MIRSVHKKQFHFNHTSHVKSYTYWVNQFLREKRYKKWNLEYKQKQYRLFKYCNIFDLFTSRTEEIAWWTLFLNLKQNRKL